MTSTQAKDWLFDKRWGGLAVFMDTYSWKEQRARSLLAKWMHTYGPELTAQAMHHIKDKHPMEPVSRGVAWLQAVHDREAKKRRSSTLPRANLPPRVPLDERVDVKRFAALRAMLEGE